VPSASADAVTYDLAEQARDIYGKRIRPGDIVLDVGANVGVFTRKALNAGASKVIAMEPAPENLECLRRTFEPEIRELRVVTYPKGIWDRDDVLTLRVDPTDSARDTFVRDIPNATSVQVPLTTIDKLMRELKLPRVDFIKMDIEGAEAKALSGTRGAIQSFHPRMAICVYHLQGDYETIPRLVRTLAPNYSVSQSCLCTKERIIAEVAFFY
jgi:FkbM family methyltransferase